MKIHVKHVVELIENKLFMTNIFQLFLSSLLLNASILSDEQKTLFVWAPHKLWQGRALRLQTSHEPRIFVLLTISMEI